MDKWDRPTTKLFISLYKQCPCLYDSKHDYFTSKSKRYEKYNFILNELKDIKSNITVSDIKKKIRTLQCQMSKERRRFMRTKKQNQIYVPRLWCFNELSFVNMNFEFLNSAYKNAPTIKEQDVNNDEETGTNIYDNEDITNQISCEDISLIIKHEPPEDINDIADEIETTNKSYSPTIEHINDEPKLPLSMPGLPLATFRKRPALDKLEEDCADEEFLTEDLFYFGRYVASQLRRLPAMHSVQCQKKIVDMITIELVNIIEPNAVLSNSSDPLSAQPPVPSALKVAKIIEKIPMSSANVFKCTGTSTTTTTSSTITTIQPTVKPETLISLQKKLPQDLSISKFTNQSNVRIIQTKLTPTQSNKLLNRSNSSNPVNSPIFVSTNQSENFGHVRIIQTKLPTNSTNLQFDPTDSSSVLVKSLDQPKKSTNVVFSSSSPSTSSNTHFSPSSLSVCGTPGAISTTNTTNTTTITSTNVVRTLTSSPPPNQPGAKPVYILVPNSMSSLNKISIMSDIPEIISIPSPSATVSSNPCAFNLPIIDDDTIQSRTTSPKSGSTSAKLQISDVHK